MDLSVHRSLPTHCQFRTHYPQAFTAKDDNSLTKAGCTNNKESVSVHVAEEVKMQLDWTIFYEISVF